MTMGWDPGPKYQFYLARIQGILSDEKRTVRDIYYALEARGFPEECREHGFEFNYRYVKRAVKKGRRAGYIDPELIIDTSRQAVAEPKNSFPDAETWVRNNEYHIKNNYHLNPWDDQPEYVEVWLEKAALSSVFEPICDEYNVRLEPTRGDWSDSKTYEATKRIIGKVDEGKDVVVLYYGDFNPSGLHAPVAVQETMGHYGLDIPREFDGGHYFNIWPFSGPVVGASGGSIKFERVALNLDQIERFSLPENPTPSSTLKDETLRERFIRRVSDGRDINIELNALKEFEREYLEDLVEESIQNHVDDETWDETENRQDEIQDKIRDAVDISYDDL